MSTIASPGSRYNASDSFKPPPIFEKQGVILSQQNEMLEKRDSQIDIAKSSDSRLDSISGAEHEIMELRREFKELKEAIIRAGIKV